MREELKRIKNEIYQVSEQDFDHIVKLCKEIISSRVVASNQYAEKLLKDNPQHAMDVLDDISYYTWVDNLCVWHFCLWIIQAIFESMITQGYLSHLSNQRLIGLKAKLTAMIRAGYSIQDSLYNDLLEWGELRNALSHCPPRSHIPVEIREEDINEYLDVIKEVITKWNSEEAKIKSH